MTRGLFVLNQQGTQINRWQIFISKWNQKWNYYVASVVVLFLFLLLVAFVVHDNMNESDVQVKTTFQIHKALFQGITRKPCCKITFQDNHLSELKKFIEKESSKLDCSEGLHLELSNINFPNNVAKTTWYQHSLPLCEITIIQSNVQYIEDYSFSSAVFKNLKILTFVDLPLEHLRKNMFQGLSNLDQFNLRLMNENLRYDPDFFLHFIRLGTLQIQNSITNPEVLLNITGSPEFDYIPVQIIDLRYNRLMKYLPEYSFRSSSLTSLYLEGAGISRIHPNAFMFANNIKLVQISQNKFQTLSEDVFVNLNNFKMEIKENDWICDCHLAWLKKQQIADRAFARCIGQPVVSFDKGHFICSSSTTKDSTTITKTTPNEETNSTTSTTYSSTLEEETTFAVETTTEAEITSEATTFTFEETTTAETTTNTKASTTAQSTNPTMSNSSLPISNTNTTDQVIMTTKESTLPSTNKLEDRTCEVLPETVDSFKDDTGLEDFIIQETKDGHLLVKCRDKRTLIWFNSSPRPEHSCTVSGYGAPNIIKGLKRDTSYIVCAEPNSTSKSIDYCKAYKTQPETEEQIWLQNKHKIPIAISGIVSFLALLLLTSTIVFYCIRQHPQLLRGNKRVVLVKNPTTDVLVMPSKKRVPVYVHQPAPDFDLMDVRNVRYNNPKNGSYLTRRDPGYMTPISRQYMQLRTRPPLARSLSETSTWTVASYVTENQIRSWRKRSHKERTPVSSVFGSPTPPPLPPPRLKSTAVEFENELDYW